MAQLVKFFQASNNLTRWLNEFFWVFSSDMAWKFGDTEKLLDDWMKEKYKIYTQLMLLSPDAFLDQETFKFAIQELFLNLIHNLSLRASQGTEHWLTKPQVFMPEEINWVYKPKVAIDWVWKKYKSFDWTKFYTGYNLYTDLGQSLLNIIYKYQGKDRTSHAYLVSQRYFKEHQSQFEVPQKNWYFFNFYLMNNLYRGVTKASDLGVSNFNEYIVRIRRSQAGDRQSSLMSKGKGWVGIIFGVIVVLVAIIIGIIAH
ncbi:hypothetical protein [Ureaplasma ceti]|uniref:Uncharacterized protein n=1 Tax=Ureaplasma ceti TaxID=3119530 RepID=A0ABP9U6K7_9BACT